MHNTQINLLDKISIRTRFALLYSIAAFSLLAVIAIFLYWESINILYRADYQFLDDEVEAMQYALQNKSIQNADLRQEVIGTPTNPDGSIYKYYIRVFDDKNQ